MLNKMGPQPAELETRKTDSMRCRLTTWLAVLLLAFFQAGCGGPSEPKSSPRTNRPQRRSKARAPSPRPDKRQFDHGSRPTGSRKHSDDVGADADKTGRKEPKQPEPRLLADLLSQPADSAARMIPNLPRLKVDETRASAEGIRKLSGKRLTLYTDIPSSKEIDSLPEILDRAFPQWCEYFSIDPAKHADWRLTGFLMKDKSRFERTGLIPDSLPPFQHGYARNYEFWLYDQPSDYYRRHLLLHEGTHCFMNTLLGACGPPWYMEGIAELLGTHRWDEGRLELNHMPVNREEVSMWGRIKIIKEAFASRQATRLKKVIEYPPHAHLETAPYAWCWAAAVLMDRHPRYQKRFRQLQKNVLRPNFNELFFKAFGDDWDRLTDEWQVLVGNLEYGHDIRKTSIDFTPGKPLGSAGASVRVAADRGWQNSRIRLESGRTYRLRASGRYQVAERPRIWWCEPGGVSIRYYQGRPLGILLAAVHPEAEKGTRFNLPPRPGGCFAQIKPGPFFGPSKFLRPIVVGLQAKLTPDLPGILFFKINDSAAELGDNAGSLNVEIKRD